MSRVEEDYIKRIFELSNIHNTNVLADNFIGNNTLAEDFGFTVQSVNEMVKKLSKKGLIEYKPYKGSRLTQLGYKTAIRMIRIHRLWEEFLVSKLGYSWKEVHEEAEKLEHVTSPLLEKKLYSFLEKPEYCPHGGAIPDLEGNINHEYMVPLSECEVGKYYCLKRVIDDVLLLEYLEQNNMDIDTKFKVEKIDIVNNNLLVLIEDEQAVIGLNVVRKIFVDEIK